MLLVAFLQSTYFAHVHIFKYPKRFVFKITSGSSFAPREQMRCYSSFESFPPVHDSVAVNVLSGNVLKSKGTLSILKLSLTECPPAIDGKQFFHTSTSTEMHIPQKLHKRQCYYGVETCPTTVLLQRSDRVPSVMHILTALINSGNHPMEYLLPSDNQTTPRVAFFGRGGYSCVSHLD